MYILSLVWLQNLTQRKHLSPFCTTVSESTPLICLCYDNRRVKLWSLMCNLLNDSMTACSVKYWTIDLIYNLLLDVTIWQLYTFLWIKLCCVIYRDSQKVNLEETWSKSPLQFTILFSTVTSSRGPTWSPKTTFGFLRSVLQSTKKFSYTMTIFSLEKGY